MTTTAAATKTRTVDAYGNVTYIVTRGGVTLGQIDKRCNGYQATFANGSYIPAQSIKQAMELLAKWTQ